MLGERERWMPEHTCLEVAGVIDVLQDGGLCVQVGRHIDGDVLLACWYKPDGHAQQICAAIDA